MHGKGKFVAQNGRFSYVGEWMNDEPNGSGVETYPDGSVYRGMFANGVKFDDKGTYEWPNGKVYVGGFRAGYMQGRGELTMKNGKGRYVGEFQKNLKIGRGTMTTETGEYQGAFENGMMHGRGTFKWFDGKIYEGEFDKNQLHGNGTMYYGNGQKVEGIWHRGENKFVKNIGAGSAPNISPITTVGNSGVLSPAPIRA